MCVDVCVWVGLISFDPFKNHALGLIFFPELQNYYPLQFHIEQYYRVVGFQETSVPIYITSY